MNDDASTPGPVGSPVDRGVGRLTPERSVRHLLTPDMIAAEDAAGGVVAAGALATKNASACPFCGRDYLLGVEPHPEGGFLSVRCRACGCIGPARRSESDAEAWAAWNNRETPNVQAERATDGATKGCR